MNCECKNKQHSSREMASGAFWCNVCNKFIACQGNNCTSLAEFIEDGQYVCQRHAIRKDLEEWNMLDALERRSNETVFRL